MINRLAKRSRRFRRLTARISLALAAHLEVGEISVYQASRSQDHAGIARRVREALALLRRTDPRRHRTVRYALARLLVVEDPVLDYSSSTDCGAISRALVENSTPATLAAVLVRLSSRVRFYRRCSHSPLDDVLSHRVWRRALVAERQFIEKLPPKEFVGIEEYEEYLDRLRDYHDDALVIEDEGGPRRGFA